jgi:hypothetical protein
MVQVAECVRNRPRSRLFRARISHVETLRTTLVNLAEMCLRKLSFSEFPLNVVLMFKMMLGRNPDGEECGERQRVPLLYLALLFLLLSGQ